MCCPCHRDREVHNHSFGSLLHPCYHYCDPAQGGRSVGAGKDQSVTAIHGGGFLLRKE